MDLRLLNSQKLVRQHLEKSPISIKEQVVIPNRRVTIKRINHLEIKYHKNTIVIKKIDNITH